MNDFELMLREAFKASRATTPAKRRAVYERAREFLQARIAKMEPGPSPTRVQQLQQQLEATIDRLEKEAVAAAEARQQAKRPGSAPKAPPSSPPPPVQPKPPQQPKPKPEPAPAPAQPQQAAPRVRSQPRRRFPVWLLGVLCGVGALYGFQEWQRQQAVAEAERVRAAAEVQESRALQAVIDRVERRQP
ncbi:hypothetical protein [Actomonas aquatica]|uniref:Uncharacterized protein n=1 Tax=Actomonas aquatica TaxID=2866162 RepID=A0ABZ1C2M0_9BACT|nr:hypothetical protein [Opitutus sp. WL0086]WRQ85595.1 hypothetical protein K1X11_012355 [Opitutus sp. WL0086]